MSRKTLHIVVLEPSYMVYEGLLGVLNQLNRSEERRVG